MRKELTRGKGVKVSCQKSRQRKNPEKSTFFEASEEAQTGFEPVNHGVADRRLTAWLLRHIHIITNQQTTVNRTICNLSQ